MESNIRYYVELVSGERKPATWVQVMQLISLHGYRYILREPNLEVVAK